jgi:cytochrome c oxidase subunit 2
VSTALDTFAGLILPDKGVSPNAEDIFELYLMLLIMSAVVFFVVEGLLIWFTLKFKARRGRVAAQIHGNTRLEVGWTIGAAVILVFITAVTFIKLPGIKDPAASDIDAQGNPVAAAAMFASTDQPAPPRGDSLNITVDGQQYVWRYQYPRQANKTVFAYEEMVVPLGMTVILRITADDVIHSWWIPALGGKMDAVPGYVNKTWFKATKVGTYKGQCAELCGRNHANMTAQVRVVPFDEYQAWYDREAEDIKTARDEAARQRDELLKRQQEEEQSSEQSSE